MHRWLKKHFIPHEGNDHRPHLLRRSTTHTIIAAIIFFELIAFIIPTLTNLNFADGMAAVLPAVLGELTNEEREAQKLPVLMVNPLLTEAAEMKATDMAMKGYFQHTSPEGKTPWYWIELAGYRYQYAGENLAVNFRDSEDVTKAWLASPTHKANIVKGAYTEMGTGIARGKYKGRNTIFVAQVYANPLPAALTASGVASQETVDASSRVLGAESAVYSNDSDVQRPTVGRWTSDGKVRLWQRLVASPRNTTNILFSLIFIIVATALTLYTAIKVRGHERDLIGNGLAVLAIIGAIFVANYYWSYRSMVIMQSYDYAFEDTI